jgi:hypothetical protein
MCPQIDLDMLAALSLLQTKISVNPIRLTMFEHCLVSIAYCTASVRGDGHAHVRRGLELGVRRQKFSEMHFRTCDLTLP